MFCPSCGTELTSELVYCNRCGANLRSRSSQTEASGKMVGMTWAISSAVVLVALAGFGLIFALAMTLISSGINLSDGGIALIVFFLLIVLAIVWLLTRQLARVLDIAKLLGEEPSSTTASPALSERPFPQISAPREPVSSVTENTTRTFEPISKQRDIQR